MSATGDNHIPKNGILLFSGGWTIGGVEKVTVTLSNEFVRRGRSVVIAFFTLQDDTLLSQLDSRVIVTSLSGGSRYANRKALRLLVKDNGIRYILDAFHCPIFLRWSCMGLGVKIIRYHHNKPDTNGHIKSARNWISRTLWRVLTRFVVRLDYWLDDAYVILSESFRKPFIRFTGIHNPNKLYVVNNPLTIDTNLFDEKKNVVLYCGRLDETQKCVSRIFEVWKLVFGDLPGWRLEIVGDGPDREWYEDLAKNIPGVTFVGFQDPGPYYAKAKLLLMASDFEGWPLVLLESMHHGCVPIVLGSYEAVYDVITNEKNGMVVPVPFDAKLFALVVKMLAVDAEVLSRMSFHAQQTSLSFTAESVVDKWEMILHSVER